MRAHNPTARALFALCAAACAVAPAAGQTDTPFAFVTNNGNLEGSVSSLAINPDGSVTLVDRIVLGTRSSTSQPCPACNADAISVSPDGRLLAVSHASGSNPEQITVLEVAPDGTLSLFATTSLPETGLDIRWVDNDRFVAPITTLSGTNQIKLWRVDRALATITLLDTEPAGSFLTSVAVDPAGRWVYTNDSFADTVRVFGVEGDDLVLRQTLPIPIYGTALALSPDGATLYASGGISGGGDKFAAYSVDQGDGTLAALPGSPFTSPGASPKGFAFSDDGTLLFVSHGTDATVRVFDRDTATGLPTDTGASYDVGLQGTLQDMAVFGGVLYAMDNSTAVDGVQGVVPLAIDPMTGTLTLIGSGPVDTGGISPTGVAVWAPSCPADLTGDGNLNNSDINAFVNAFLAQDPSADFNADGNYNNTDINAFVNAFLAGCS